jgi:hypothetical protein
MKRGALAVVPLLLACASAPAPRACPSVRAAECPEVGPTEPPPDLAAAWERLNEIVAELDHVYQATMSRAREEDREVLAALDRAALAAFIGARELLVVLGCADCAGESGRPDVYHPGASASSVLAALGAALETVRSVHSEPAFACRAERAWAGAALRRLAWSVQEAGNHHDDLHLELDALARSTDDRRALAQAAAVVRIARDTIAPADFARFERLASAANGRAARAEARALATWLEASPLELPSGLAGVSDLADTWPADIADSAAALEAIDVPLDHETRPHYEDALARVEGAVRACRGEAALLSPGRE